MLINDDVFKEQELPFSDERFSDKEPDDIDPDEGYDWTDCSICSHIHDYRSLTWEMIEEIKFLRAEIIRWRQVLIKFLSPDWADGLRQDILDNVFQHFEDYDAYKDFVNNCCEGVDPLENKEQSELIRRLIEGTDETSITYLE